MSRRIFPIKSHPYHEYPENAEIIKRIIKQADERELIEGISRFIDDKAEVRNLNETELQKVSKSVIEGRTKGKNKVKILRNKSPREIIRKSVELGYIVNFKLNIPWHYEIFSNPNMATTYPFQHKFSVWYRREQDHVWFSEEACEKLVQQKNFSEFYNHKSVFNTGELKPGSGHEKDQHKTDGGEFSPHHQEATYWDNSPDITGSSAIGHSGRWKGEMVRTSIIEAVIPTRYIEIHMKNRGRRGKYTDSLKEIHELYGSPKNYREDFDYWETRVVKESVSLKHIRGIYPEERGKGPEEGFKEKYFLSTEDFHKYLYSSYPEAVPANPRCLDQNLSKNGEGHSKEELQDLQKELKLIHEIEEILADAKSGLGVDGLSEIYYLVEDTGMSPKSDEERVKIAIEGLEKYNSNIRKVKNILTEEFEIAAEWNEIKSFQSLLGLLQDKSLIKLLKESRRELEEIRAEAYQKTETHQITDHVYDKFNKYMISELSRIPLIMLSEREIVKNIDKMKAE